MRVQQLISEHARMHGGSNLSRRNSRSARGLILSREPREIREHRCAARKGAYDPRDAIIFASFANASSTFCPVFAEVKR